MAWVLGWSVVSAQEESLVFVDANGNVVPDGTTIELRDVEGGDIDPMTGETAALQIPTGLSVRKVTDGKVAAQMNIDISSMPNGSFQTCSFGSCLPEWTKAGVYTSSKNIVTKELEPITTEWYPEAYATWTATLQIQYMKIEPNRFGLEQATSTVVGNGPKVTLRFVYADPAGIKDVDTNRQVVEVEHFDISGKRTDVSRKGVHLVRMSDGTVKKTFVSGD